jgi:hypothetical protein
MKHFVIHFEQKEGSTAMVRLLDNFDQVSLVRAAAPEDFEPFDAHVCGRISTKQLEKRLSLFFDHQPESLERLNRIYSKRAKRALAFDRNSPLLGFKMRFEPPISRMLQARGFSGAGLFDHLTDWNINSKLFLRRLLDRSFREMMFRLYAEHDAVVFVTVRQDTFRRALSIYHGDGSGRPGHLQFRLALGHIKRSDIPKIHVDLRRFEKVLKRCEADIAFKRQLIDQLRAAGIRAYPLIYEVFLDQKVEFFKGLLERLELSVSVGDINAAIAQGSFFEKVHSHDISTFVHNHEEISNAFGHRVADWHDETKA